MRARGYTLLELMIAIAIGLLLVAGLMTITNAMKHTTGTENNLTLLQDNQRMAITLMSDTIQEAGYFPAPLGGKTGSTEFGAVPVNASNITAGGLPMSAGQAIVGASAGDGQDAVSVRYETSGADNVLDCAGKAYTTTLGIIDTFQLDGAGNFACYTTTYAPPSPGATATPVKNVLVSSTGQTIGGGQSGIQYVTITYGVQSNLNSGVTSIDAYLPASAVTANNLWPYVYSMRVTFTMLSTSDVQPSAVAKTNYQLCPSVAYADLATLPAKCSITHTISIMNKAGIH